MIDPGLPSLPTAMSQELCRKRERVWGKSSSLLDLSASFRTQQRAIDLELAIVAPPNVSNEPLHRGTPARVYISSEQGRIQADLVSLSLLERPLALR